MVSETYRTFAYRILSGYVLTLGVLLLAAAAWHVWLYISPESAPLASFPKIAILVWLAHACCSAATVAAVLAAKVVRQEEATGAADIALDVSGRARTVAASLRARARRLRLNSVLSLVLMIVALVAGLVLFYKAEDISDSATAHLLDQIERNRIETDKALADLSDTTSGLVDQAQIAATVRAKKERGSYYYSESQQREEQRLRAELQTAMVRASTAIAAATREVQANAKNVQRNVLALSNSDRTRRVVSVIATRVGAVLILVFLVQILASLYRYNVRLAAYYESRADALELAIVSDGTVDAARLQSAAAVISPERIEFGREPRSPLETSAELAGAILAAQSAALKKQQGGAPGA